MNFFHNLKHFLGVSVTNSDLFCGIAFNYHDSSVSFAIGNAVVLVLEAERIFGVKKKCCTKEEMEYLIQYGLKLLNKNVSDVSYWSMTTFNNPYLVGLDSTVVKIRDPYWGKAVFLGGERDVYITNHHVSHAATYLATSFDKAIIISCDGGGDIDPLTKNNECSAVFTGNGNIISKISIDIPKLITGKTYGICASFIYGTNIHDKERPEGKFMALAGYGEIDHALYAFFEDNFQKIESAVYDCAMDILENSQFSHLRGQALKNTQEAKNFSATLHQFFIEKRMKNTDYILNKIGGGPKTLILAGGVGLNLDLNTKIFEKYPNLQHFVAPCCDDTGQSLGSLCLLITQITGRRPIVNLPYLGEGNKVYHYKNDTLDKAVDILIHDGILLIHNGTAEVGPRALGNRSFVARPDRLSVKTLLSEKIKLRESYRPVAPVVIEDKTHDYFNGPSKSPYMLYRYEIRKENKEKILGAAHIDNSARVQTLNRDTNNFFYDLIKKFGERTGIYVLLNTSLNLKGHPLSNTIDQSLEIYDSIPGPKGLIYNGEIIAMIK